MAGSQHCVLHILILFFLYFSPAGEGSPCPRLPPSGVTNYIEMYCPQRGQRGQKPRQIVSANFPNPLIFRGILSDSGKLKMRMTGVEQSLISLDFTEDFRLQFSLGGNLGADRNKWSSLVMPSNASSLRLVTCT